MDANHGCRRLGYGLLRRWLNRAAMGIVVLGTTVCHQTASAALMDQGLTTLDTGTKLEWLDMSQSVDISAQSIIDGAGPGAALVSQGWVLASIRQITDLFLDGGMIPPFDGTQSPLSYPGVSLIMSLLGQTGSFGDEAYIQAFAGEGPASPPGFLYTPSLLVCSICGVGGADMFGAGGTPAFVADPTIGSWLVRTATVPEPATIALFGIGLAGLGLSRRRRPR